MSRVFISFLGISQYVWCNYRFDEKCVIGPVRFVQEALIRHLCKDWSVEDRFIIFLTKEAWGKNWEPESDSPDKEDKYFDKKPCWGLRKTCDLMNNDGINIQIKPVKNIPEGFTEEQMWELFSIIVEQVNEGDDVFLDITHGFRNLPMLANVLLDYLRVVKSTKIGGIYYGAFDSLGPAYKVRKRATSERNAPVVNLTRFHELQQWVDGAEQLIRFGNPKKVCEVIETRASQSLKKSKGKDETAKELNLLQKNLTEVYNAHVAIRGNDVLGFDPIRKKENPLFRNTRDNLEKVISSDIWFTSVKTFVGKNG